MASSYSNNLITITAFMILVSLTSVIKCDNNNIILEEGYTVTTLIDGDKLTVNPYAVVSLYGSSSDDLVILDSVKSTFYTVTVSGSQVSEINKLSGNDKGNAGYKDGDLGSAEFNKPKSFTVDKKNNIYIADKSNHVIRKISKSGVTTIAGGNIRKTGKADGPAQNASFSDDFELAFDLQRCALLISDHGNRLIRQIDLKAEDCADTSSGPVLGSTIAWGIGVVVMCLIGFIVGFAVRPYVLPYEGQHPVNVTWKHFLTNLGKQAVTFYFVARNATASRNNLYHIVKSFLVLSFSQLPLLFGVNIVSPSTIPKKLVSLLDLDCADVVMNETTQTRDLVDELKDLMTLDGTQSPKLCLNLNQENDGYIVEEIKEAGVENGGKIDKHIYANLVGFVEGSKRN
ncbi:uncharacterized protein LOC143592033 isoform X2 [Bidens hawaiensis]|uniref:uncharacterized protein LOC143592033 isoform X2 n=1 Tax=Bidens hawaiensis TaxID=980011 RepID=UPI00404A857F